ncbi:MAG: DUF1269 domain-containing protein [Candidatus Eremiobacteraeota bacterium]|nr:DUF1269 domain-containing protein [Candidatus Eremiobacteraeota bacterium]
MTDLIVLVFDNDRAAFEVRDKLIELQKSHLIRLADAAVAVRDQQGVVKIKQVVDLTAQGAIGGAFWGLLAGILFWMPAMGAAIGTLIGAISGSMADYGVNDEFIEQVAKSVEPGQSALFLLVVDATMDRVIEEISAWNPKVLRTNLSREQERKLREAFSEAQMEDHLKAAPPTQLL